MAIPLDFNIINWNIGGAKYLQLKSDPTYKIPNGDLPHNLNPRCREEFRYRLEFALWSLIHARNRPHAVTLQEVVQFEASGKHQLPENLINPEFFDNLGYRFHFFPLIDTRKFSSRAKWNKVKEEGVWEDCAYFAQGNAILVRKDIHLFPVWSIPVKGLTLDEYLAYYRRNGAKDYDDVSEDGVCDDNIPPVCRPGAHRDIERASEVVYVERGLYFGDRNTEPRAAIVTHIVLYNDPDDPDNPDKQLERPLDLFIVNTHLTTLSHEREGIPAKDEEARNRRVKQLDIVFNDIVSRYNSWKQEKGYKLREEKYPVNSEIETTERYRPVWVVAGDFNFTPQSTEYEYIKQRNFMDLVNYNEAIQPPTKAKGLGNEPSLILDYVFGGPLYYSIHPKDALVRIENINIVSTDMHIRVSDHYPLLVRVPILIDVGEGRY